MVRHPTLKAGVVDGDARKFGQLTARDAGEVRAHFDADDAATAAGQRQGCLSGPAADFEDVGEGRVETCLREEIVQDRRGTIPAAEIVELGDLVEGACPANSGVFIHGWGQFNPAIETLPLSCAGGTLRPV